MTLATLNRSRAPARALPSSRDEAGAVMQRLRIVRAALAQHQAQLDADIAALQAERTALADHLVAEERQLVDDLTAWCASRRAELTDSERRKTVEFPDGTVAWRKRPPSVEIDDVEAAIVAFVRAGRTDLLRTKTTIDKQGVLKLGRDAAAQLGVRISTEVEDIIIKTQV